MSRPPPAKFLRAQGDLAWEGVSHGTAGTWACVSGSVPILGSQPLPRLSLHSMGMGQGLSQFSALRSGLAL